jgi:hypothetical protein
MVFQSNPRQKRGVTVLVETGYKHKVGTGRGCGEGTTRQIDATPIRLPWIIHSHRYCHSSRIVSFWRWWPYDPSRRRQQFTSPQAHKFSKHLGAISRKWAPKNDMKKVPYRGHKTIRDHLSKMSHPGYQESGIYASLSQSTRRKIPITLSAFWL